MWQVKSLYHLGAVFKIITSNLNNSLISLAITCCVLACLGRRPPGIAERFKNQNDSPTLAGELVVKLDDFW